MVYILLPAFNEEQSLREEVTRIDGACRAAGLEYEVVIVDDGSRDATAEIAHSLSARLPVRLLVHASNQGLGAALRTGLADLVERADDDDCIVMKDADNTQDPALIRLMRSRIAHGADVVIASRFQRGGREVGLATHRRILSRGAGILFQCLCPVPGVRDYTCGYRAFRVATLVRAWSYYAETGGLVERGDFSATAELLLKVARLTDRIEEVPLVLRYDLKGGRSKMRIWRAIRGNLDLALSIRHLRASERTARRPSVESAPSPAARP
jgi:dolichol-phosphate mannosyltransferase